MHERVVHAAGGYDILQHIETRLGIKAGETTPDGAFSIVEEECLAACANAPMMICGDDYFLDLTPKKVDDVLDELRRRSARATTEDARPATAHSDDVRRRPGRGEGLTRRRPGEEAKDVKIVTKNFGVTDSHKLSRLPAARRWRGLPQGADAARRRPSSTR